MSSHKRTHSQEHILSLSVALPLFVTHTFFLKRKISLGQARIYTYIHTYIHAYIHTYTHTHIHTHTHTHTHTHIHYIYVLFLRQTRKTSCQNVSQFFVILFFCFFNFRIWRHVPANSRGEDGGSDSHVRGPLARRCPYW